MTKPSPPLSHSIDLNLCDSLSDFGRGFYTTTNIHEAKNWANERYDSLRGLGKRPGAAAVLSFEVDRNFLATLQSLTFVLEESNRDFWDFVTYCRLGKTPHLLWENGDYDVVYGPVSVWPQLLVIKDCDQISFYTNRAIRLLPRPRLKLGKRTFNVRKR